MKKNKWQKSEVGTNLVYQLSDKDNYASYNPKANDGPFKAFASLVGESAGVQEETALFYDQEWYILKGDFRKQVEACKTDEEIKEFYKKHGLTVNIERSK